jgi:dihydrolipoamide dehydrogenase
MYDVIILGAGPGGYVAAERASAEGLKTLLVEKSHLGGVCLNAGCIPTKTLLSAAKIYAHAKDAESVGVSFENAVFHLDKAMAWKNRVIETLRKGIAGGMKHGGVEVLQGEGHLSAPGVIRVNGKDYQGKNVILAPGSSPLRPPIPGIDDPRVMTSTEILSLERMPERVCIIGGGYIGMEFASFFSLLGIPVTVVEMMDEIIPILDRDMSALLRKSLKGIQFELGARVEEYKDGRVVFVREGVRTEVPADCVLLSIGRKPNLEGMGFREAGLDMGKTGIRTDERMRTNLPGVYAAGDATGLSLLAHSASRMGEIAVNDILGRKDRWRSNGIPWVVFTDPEVAGCGITEDEAKKRNIDARTVTVPLRLSGRYIAEHPKEQGICKVTAEARTGVILGVTMLGSGCSEMIFGAAVMIEAELRFKDLRDMVFPHPTVSEVIREAMFKFENSRNKENTNA